MSELLRFRAGEDGVIVVEADPSDAGVQRVGRGGVVDVKRRFEDALTDIQHAAAAALAVFRDGDLKPDGVELEFGIKLNAEAGAVIAKTSLEGHLTVKLSWNPGKRSPVSCRPCAPHRSHSVRMCTAPAASPHATPPSGSAVTVVIRPSPLKQATSVADSTS